jgi:hypothetical protein
LQGCLRFSPVWAKIPVCQSSWELSFQARS